MARRKNLLDYSLVTSEDFYTITVAGDRHSITTKAGFRK